MKGRDDMMTMAQWNQRIENQYRAMCAFPICDLFSWKIAPGQSVPRVKSYIITYRVKTMVMDGGRLRSQERTVIRIDMPDTPNSAPTARVVEGKVPFHPNFYVDGRLCPGNMWVTDPILWKFVIKIGQVIAFDPQHTNPASPANREAAEDWNRKQTLASFRKPYPCGRTDFPHPVGY